MKINKKNGFALLTALVLLCSCVHALAADAFVLPGLPEFINAVPTGDSLLLQTRQGMLWLDMASATKDFRQPVEDADAVSAALLQTKDGADSFYALDPDSLTLREGKLENGKLTLQPAVKLQAEGDAFAFAVSGDFAAVQLWNNDAAKLAVFSLKDGQPAVTVEKQVLGLCPAEKGFCILEEATGGWTVSHLDAETGMQTEWKLDKTGMDMTMLPTRLHDDPIRGGAAVLLNNKVYALHDGQPAKLLAQALEGSAKMHDFTFLKDGRMAMIGYDLAILSITE